MRIAVIGAGIAGIQVLGALLAHKNRTLDVTIIDHPRYAGRGMPFINDHPSLLLNQPQTVMDLVGARQTFTDWLQHTHPKTAGERYATRRQFGDYARDTFDALMRDERVRFKPARIDRLQKMAQGGYRLYAGQRSQGQYEHVFLCIGQLPYNDPYGLVPSANFIADPYPLNRLWPVIGKTRSIGILGSSLSTIDIIGFLAAKKYAGKIYILAKTGRFPSVRGDEPQFATPFIARALQRRKTSLTDLVKAYQSEIGRHKLPVSQLLPQQPESHAWLIDQQITRADEMGRFQQLVKLNELSFQRVWEQLSLTEQQWFNEEFRESFLLLQSPMPAQSARTLAGLLESGQAQVVDDIERINAGKRIDVTTAEGHLRMAYLLNATGPATSLEAAGYHDHNYRLAANLVDQRVLQPDPIGGFMVMLPGFCAVSQRYGVQADLRVHGQLVSGLHFANNSVRKIGMGAQASVEDLLG